MRNLIDRCSEMMVLAKFIYINRLHVYVCVCVLVRLCIWRLFSKDGKQVAVKCVYSDDEEVHSFARN